MLRIALSIVALVTMSCVASEASADVIPPAESSCQGRAAGDACTLDGMGGSCVASTCSRLDYAGWDRDAMPSPPSVEYDCLVCEARAGGGGGGGGCSVASGRGETAGALVMLLAAFGAAAATRARRR